MRRHVRWIILICGSLTFLVCAAAEPRATTAHSDYDPSFIKAADNPIYAQKLVNELAANNPDLLVIGLHAIKPGTSRQLMIASNLDRIGKDDDDDDRAIVTEKKTILVPNPKEPNKFEVLLPLKDASGLIIGALGLVYNYKPGGDELKMHRKALALRDSLATKTPDLAALFARADLSAARKSRP